MLIPMSTGLVQGLGLGPWDVSSAVFIQATNVVTNTGAIRGVWFKPDGTRLYAVDGGASRGVDEYSLSSAWDTSTLSYVRTFSISGQTTSPQGLSFKPDGTKMYVCGFGVPGSVYEYSLSSAWDVSSASYVDSFTVGAEGNFPRNIVFKDDGTKVFIFDGTDDEVNEYTLSTAWDISSASFLQSFTFLSGTTTGGFIGLDGERLYYFYQSSNPDFRVDQYNLSTAWDVSTSVYDQRFTEDIAAGVVSAGYPFFSPDGTKMYFSDAVAGTIREYDLG